jgi:hypothetical protein
MGIEETARLILEADPKGFPEAQAALAGAEKELADLNARYQAGGIGLEEYLAKGTKLQAAIDDQRAVLEVAKDAIKQHGSAAAGAASLTDQYRAALAAQAKAAEDQARADREAIQAVGELQQAKAALAASSHQVNAALAAEQAEADRAAIALGHERNAIFAAENAMETFTVEASQAASATGKVGAAAGATRAGMGNLQQSMIAGSYAFQDFTSTSGDLGAKLNSVTNNIPTLLAGLGGVGIAMGIAATAGVAVYRNWDSISSLWETRNPFPKAADDISGLKRELDRAKDGLEKFEKAGTGTAESIAKYNELRTRTAELEKEIADQQERQATIKRALESKDEAQEGRAKGFQEATKGQGQQTLDAITAALEAQGQAEVEAADVARKLRIQAFEAEGHTAEERAAFAREQADIFRSIERGVRASDFEGEAKKLFAGLLNGEERAGVLLQRLTDNTGRTFGDLAERAKAADPALKKKQDELVEKLNKQGEEGEKAALKEVGEIDKAMQARAGAEIEALKQSGGVEKLTDMLRADAKEKGLKGADEFEFVKSGFAATLKGVLGDKGLKADADQVERVATQAAGAARRADVKDETKAGKAEDKATDDEVKQINARFAQPFQEQFETATATNQGIIASGGPVARNAAQEAQLRRQGVPYAVPNAVLSQRLQAQMTQGFQRQGFGAQASNLAAAGIAEKGTAELTRELASKQGTNQQNLIALAADHNAMFAQVMGLQARQGQQIAQLRQQSGRLQGQARENQHAAQDFGGPQ